MKKQRLSFFVAVILFFIYPTIVSGQELLDRPVPIYKMTDDLRVKYDPDSPKSGIIWLAFSAQDNNQTYQTSGGDEAKKYPGFLEKLYITDINGKYAHVYKDNDLDRLNWAFSSSAEDYGWIELKNLILSNHCLVTERSQIAKKCMILNTYSSLKKKELKDAGSDFVNFYLDPDLQQKTGEQSKIFQIFYIYKMKYKKGKPYSLLIGVSPSIADPEDRKDVKNTIKGWIPFDRIVEWNHRIAVEPNSEYEAADERKKKNTKASIFESFDKSLDFQQGKPVNPNFVVWDKDSYEERKSGAWIRFPLINDDRGMYTLGVMGNLESVHGDLLSTREEDADMREKTASLAKKYRKINVLFIVDGTSSMGKYFQSSIIPAITETVNTLVENEKLNDFHFGALIYRDADEGDRLTEQIPLTTNTDELIKRLKRVEARDYADLSKGEALYKGLYSGFRGVLNSNDETNLVILIGDAGNREDSRTHVGENQLIDIMVKRNASIVCFQVFNGSNPEFDDFKTQTMRLINDVAKTHMENIEETQNIAGQKSGLIYKEGKNNSYIWDGAKYFECIYANEEETKSTSYLKKAIVRAIAKENERINNIITTRNLVFEEGVSIDKATKTVSAESDNAYDQTDALGAGFFKLMKDAGLTDDQIARAIQDKIQIYNEGYSPITVAGLNNPLYERVLLYSAEEFNRMYGILNDLLEARDAVARREKLYDTWVDILKRYLGDIDKSELEEMSVGEVQEMVFGLPGVEGLIKNLSLRDIKNESKLNDKELNIYLSNIKKKYRKIEGIINDVNNPLIFYTNNKKYYWIDEDFIP